MRVVDNRALVVVVVVLSFVGAAAAAPPEKARTTTWLEDARGRLLRVGFDAGSRWMVGGAVGLTADGDVAGALETELAYRSLLDFPDEDVAWKMVHTMLGARVLLDGATRFDDLSLTATLYEGRYHRWMREGFITVPLNPPKHLPFPLNIGAEGVVCRFETRPDDPETIGELTVQRAQIVFDFWRSRRLGSTAQIGFGPSYDIVLGKDRLTHHIAPFTRATAQVRHEWESGRQVVDVRGDVGYAWSTGDEWVLQATATAGYELIVLAVNDWPLSVFADVEYRFRDDHDVRGLAGVRMAIPLTH